MQNLPVYLYPNSITLTLDLDTNVRGVNQVMYQRDLKIQKGIKNQIRIQFKNSDQKNIRIYSTQTFVFSMFDATEQRLLIEKNLDVLDSNTTSTKGQALLTLTENDTLDLTKSNYNYSIKMLDSDGTYLPTYANTYYGIVGNLYILEDIYPVLKPSQEIKEFQTSFNGDTNLYEHKSGNTYAYPEYNGNNALHTMALYMTGFRGTVSVQATMYNSPASLGRYATIETRTYTNFTGIDYINFYGIYSYVRVVYIPAVKPGESTNDNTSYFGKFDKALYRS